MATARTFRESGTWGITSLDPAAASSSPFYVLILAALHLLFGGVQAFEWMPLLINGLAMAGCLLVWDRILTDVAAATPAGTLSPGRRFAMLMVLAAATPLFVLTLIGMEHTIQCLVDILLVYYGGKAVATQDKASWQDALLLFIAAYIVVGTRYESVLVVAPLAGAALVNGKFRYTGALVLGTLLPIVSFGLVWRGDGGWLVPNSILMKLILHDQHGEHVIQHLQGSLSLAGVMAVNVALSGLRLRPRWRALNLSGPWGVARLRSTLELVTRDWVAVFAATALAAGAVQLLTGAAGWLYRYEAAVLCLNAVSIMIQLILDHRPKVQTLVLAGLLAILAYRTIDASYLVAAAPADRRWEHVEPARFVSRFYPNQAIVVNDIGAMAWYAPSTRVLDLAGLANNDIARLRLSPTGLEWPAVADWARQGGAPLAILQICWNPIAEVIPDTWRLVALWTGPDNVLFGDRAIGVFATSQGAVATLKRSLTQYPRPDSVRLMYFDDLPEQAQARFMQALRVRHCQVVPSLNEEIQQWRARQGRPRQQP
ncbi:hypothetical protein [Nitrospirillum viridazoti]|nr:hypothetical protein [Nitrospirillum amazonense]